MEFVATVDHDAPFGLRFVPTEAAYRYMARLQKKKIARARLTCTPFDYPVRLYRMSLATTSLEDQRFILIWGILAL